MNSREYFFEFTTENRCKNTLLFGYYTGTICWKIQYVAINIICKCYVIIF